MGFACTRAYANQLIAHFDYTGLGYGFLNKTFIDCY